MSETQASEPSPWLGWALTLLFAPGLLYFANPALALILAAIMSLLLNRPVIDVPSSYGKLALQTAIVLLGLRLNIETLWTLASMKQSRAFINRVLNGLRNVIELGLRAQRTYLGIVTQRITNTNPGGTLNQFLQNLLANGRLNKHA